MTPRHFIYHSHHYNCNWEYGANTTIRDEVIQIVPPIKRTKGYLLMNERLPSEHWQSEFKIGFAKNATLSKLGIWITSNIYLNEIKRNIFAGPLKFKGIALLVQYNGKSIDIEIRESDKKRVFLTYNFFPKYHLNDLKIPTVCFNFEYMDKRLRISAVYDNITMNLFDGIPIVPIRRNWLSITADNTDSEDKVEILEIKFKSNNNNKYLTENLTRNSYPFDYLNHVLKQLKMNINYRPRTIDVISSLNDIIVCAENLIDYNLVYQIITNQLSDFTEKWQRRTILIKKQSNSLRSKITDQLNNTEAIIEYFKNDINDNVKMFNEEIHVIESDLYNGVLDGYKLYKYLKNQKKVTKEYNLSKIFLTISLIEVNIAIFFMVFFYLFIEILS